jgi:hypothetical protein
MRRDPEPHDNLLNRPRPWRPRIRINLSLRALMVLVMVIGVGMGWYLRGVRIQQDAVAAIKKAGGTVTYDWEWSGYNPNISDTLGRPRAPKWLADCVGVDFVANVVSVDMMRPWPKGSSKVDDETLAHVGRLGHLEILQLNDTAVTDAGLAHIKGLTALRDIEIRGTAVTDLGLAHLNGMKELRTLFIAWSLVSDHGVLELERALPRIQILREEDMAYSANVQAAMNDVEFARTRPVRLACALLAHRAQVTAMRGQDAELIATINALCELEPNDVLSLVKQAGALSQCVGLLGPAVSPALSPSDRQALQQKCADRGIEALRLAIDKGYNNVRRLDGEIMDAVGLFNLRNHPAYPQLVETMKAKHPGK